MLVGIKALGLSRTSVEIALVGYTLLILFRNTLAGLRGVPDEVVDAAPGHGPDAAPDPVARRAAARAAGDHRRAADRDGDDRQPRDGRRVRDRTRASARRSSTALNNELFKTELYAAAAMAVGLAMLADLGLLARAADAHAVGRGEAAT